MTIIEKINALRQQIEEDPQGDTAQDVAKLSIGAIFDGLQNEGPWKEYMSMFHTTPEQLDRLMGRDQAWLDADEDDETGEPGLGRKALAYMIAAGPCLDGTGLRLAANMPDYLATHLDDGLETDLALKVNEDRKDGDTDASTFVSA